jgi:hypothetical protein
VCGRVRSSIASFPEDSFIVAQGPISGQERAWEAHHKKTLNLAAACGVGGGIVLLLYCCFTAALLLLY